MARLYANTKRYLRTELYCFEAFSMFATHVYVVRRCIRYLFILRIVKQFKWKEILNYREFEKSTRVHFFERKSNAFSIADKMIDDGYWK